MIVPIVITAIYGLLHLAFKGIQAFESIQIYGCQLSEILSFSITLAITFLVFLKFNRLIPIPECPGKGEK